MTTTPHLPARRWRRVRLIAGMAAVMCLLAALLLHTPVVRDRVLTWAVRELASRGVRLEASRLDYNLFTLTAALENVTLTAAYSSSPFLSAERADVDVSWSPAGGFAVETLDVRRPHVTLRRGRDGAWNLPASTDGAGNAALPVRINHVRVTGMAVDYVDESANVDVAGRALSVELTANAVGHLAGRLTAGEPASVRWGETSTTITTFDGQVAFDGHAFQIDAFDIAAPEGRVHLTGSIDTRPGGDQFQLRGDGTLDAARAAVWMAPAANISGRVGFSSTVSGRFDAPVVAVAVTSTDLSWPELGPLAVDGRGTVAGGVATVDALRVALAGGNIVASGRTNLGSGASSATAQWRNLNPRDLARVLPAWTARMGSVVDGTLAVEWTGAAVADGRGTLSATLRPAVVTRRAVPLAGTLDLSLASRAWALSMDQRSGDAFRVHADARGRLDDILALSTIGGSARVVVANLDAAWRQAAAAGLVPADTPPVGLGGTATIDLVLSGTVGAPGAAGTLASNDVRIAGHPLDSVTARFDASTSAMTVDEVRLNLGPNTVTGDAVIGFQANTVAGGFNAALPDLSAFGPLLPETWRPTGAAEASIKIGGALDDPTADLIATGVDLLVAGQHLRTLRAVGRWTDGIAAIDSLEATQDQGHLTASGHFEPETRRYAVTASGEDLVLSAPVSAQFDFRLDGDGSFDQPRGTAAVDVERLGWSAYQLGPSRVDLSLSGRELRVTAVVPSASGEVAALIDLDARTVNATLSLTRADLAALSQAAGPGGDAADGEPASPVSVAGAVDLRATATGSLDDLAAMSVALEAELTAASVNGVPVRLDRPARLRRENGVLVADDVALRVGESAVRVNGRLGGTADDAGLDVQVTGSLAELMTLGRFVPGAGDIDTSGAVDIRLHASGPLPTPAIRGTVSVTNASVTASDIVAFENVSVTAALERDVLEVSELSGMWHGASVSGAASIPLAVLGERLPAAYRTSLGTPTAPARATIAVRGITPAAFSSFLGRATLERLGGVGDLLATFEADTLDTAGLRGEAVLERVELELAGVPVRQTSPTRVRLANGRLDVVDWRWESPAGRIGLGGYVRMSDDIPELNVGMAGTLDLAMLSAFAPGMAFGGRATVDVRALGTTADPQVEGLIAVANATIALRDPRIAIVGLDASATLTRDRFVLHRATASANGGTLEASGELTYSGADIGDGAITITGRGLALEVLDGLRTEADADLTLTAGDPVHALTGRVTIVRGDYRRALRLTELLFAGRGAAAPAALGTEPALLDRVRLNVTVASADDIIVSNNYGRLDLGASLAVIGTAAEPAVAGRVTVREGGQVFLGGQTYAVRRGVVDFTNPTRIEPQFDIALETRVQRNDITLELRGTPETLDVSLRSPGISQEDAVSLLLTGQPADQATIANADIARGQLLMLLSGEFLGEAGRAIGFDAVRVGRGLGGAASTFDLLATESDPNARLTLTKNLRNDVELIISQSLRDTGDITWIAAYRPVRRLELRATTDDANNEAYEFRHEVPFGGGRTREPGALPVAARRRVTALEMTDVPGLAAEDLRGELRLREGDWFDVYRWQQDRDRVLEWLRGRGFFEARVTAERQDAGADGVVLTYGIARGPRTTLRVEGFVLGASSLERMRTAWTEAVFDAFLVEDLETIARDVLVADGHLQAGVDVTIEQADDEKTAVVRIAPGPQFADRQIAFRGNMAVPAEALEQAIATQALDDVAWLDAVALADGLEEHYRSLGYLSAEITPGEPVFSPTLATLPVDVDEGERFQIGAVAIEGAVRRTPDAVRSLAGLVAGAPYEPATVEPARRRIENAYLDDGYNQVRVAAAVTADYSAGTVQVAFRIAEGPQDVLAGVDVSGASRTASSTIAQAVDLETGAPITLTDVYRAQKRLYDTSVFSSVDVSLQPVETAAPAGAERPVRAAVVLQEWPRYRLRYGFRAIDVAAPAEGTRSVRPGFVTDLLNRNVFGRAVTAGVAGQFESDRWLGRAVVSLPAVFGYPVVTNVFLTRSRQDFSSGGTTPFVEDATDVTVEQRLRPATGMSVTYGYTFSKKHSFEIDPDPNSPFPPFDISVNVARLTGTYAWDTRDDPSNASRGWFHSSGFEYGPESLGSELRFVRYLAQQYYFRRLGGRLVLASAFRFGAGRGFGQDLLPSERFYAGGGTSIRGFAEQGIGPANFLGDALGGSGLLLINQEARIRLHRWFTAVGFVDAGNVFPLIRDVSFGDLEAGAGVGLRVTSPFAIIRLDLGAPLTSRRDQPRGRWYFGIGQTF